MDPIITAWIVIFAFLVTLTTVIIVINNSNISVFFKLIRYAMNPRQWDNRIHEAFWGPSKRSYDHYHLRNLPEVMVCGCILDQVKAAPHIWVMTLNFEKCRDHKHTEKCKNASHFVGNVKIIYPPTEEIDPDFDELPEKYVKPPGEPNQYRHN